MTSYNIKILYTEKDGFVCIFYFAENGGGQ